MPLICWSCGRILKDSFFKDEDFNQEEPICKKCYNYYLYSSFNFHGDKLRHK